VSPTRRTSGLTTARALALDHPNAMLPCPLCATGVRGENLEKHLAKAHGEGAGEAVGGDASHGGGKGAGGGAFVWTGPSGRVPALAFGALAAAVVWVAATRSGLVAVAPRLEMVIAAVFVMLFASLLALCESHRLRARLVFTNGTFVLHPPLGLYPRMVSLPAKLELGSAWGRRSSATPVGADVYFTDEGARPLGGYLRLHDGTASFTVLAAGTSVREYWNVIGARRGPKRSRYDISLDAPDFVELEYLLARSGLLALKAA
jgi:hypothetical protein